MFETEMLADEAARRLGLSSARVRQLADAGDLACRRVGTRRVRVFTAGDVERLRDLRAARKPSRADGDRESGK